MVRKRLKETPSSPHELTGGSVVALLKSPSDTHLYSFLYVVDPKNILSLSKIFMVSMATRDFRWDHEFGLVTVHFGVFL